jgi:hypothetical protein
MSAIDASLTLRLIVVKIFQRHHSGSIEEYIDENVSDWLELVYSDSSFWDKWKPCEFRAVEAFTSLMQQQFSLRTIVFLRLTYPLLWAKPMEPLDPFLNIYKGPTQEIISWLCDSKRKTNVCWIVEPPLSPSSGANSRANVIASICCDADRLGGQLLFSPIRSVTAQLAARYPPYRRILAKRLVDNPRMFQLPTRVLFKKLIYELWKVVQESHPQYIAAPPVIVLHCNDDYIDEIFSSICEFSLYPHSSSLLWIVSVGWMVKLPIRGLIDPLPRFGIIKHPVRYDDGASDAAFILRHAFRKVRPRSFDDPLRLEPEDTYRRREEWPSDEQISHLARIVSGVLESIDVVIAFVNRQDGGAPEAYLETFLGYMIDSPSPSDERPCCALDHFYTRAFSNVPPPFITVATEVLGIIYYKHFTIVATHLQTACLLSAPKATTILSVYTYLSGWAVTGIEQQYQTPQLFRNFLTDPKRSGKFSYSLEMAQTAFESFLRFLSCSSNLFEFLTLRGQSFQVVPETFHEIEDLRRSVSQMFCDTDTTFRSAVLERVLTLRPDFRCLAYTSDAILISDFMKFLQELCEVSP